MEAMEDRLSWFISEELKVRQHDMLFSAPIDVTELLGPNYVAGPATLYSSLLDATAGVPLGLPSAQAALQSIPVSLGLVGSTLRINTSHSRGSARVPIGGYVDGNASIAITVPFFGRLDADVALTARLGVEATVQLIASFEDVEILSFGGLTFGAHVRSINLTVGAVLDYESLDISHALITVTDGSALIGAAANALIDVAIDNILAMPIVRAAIDTAIQGQIDSQVSAVRELITQEVITAIDSTSFYVPEAGPICEWFGPCHGPVGEVIDRLDRAVVIFSSLWTYALCGWLATFLVCCFSGCKCMYREGKHRLSEIRSRRSSSDVASPAAGMGAAGMGATDQRMGVTIASTCAGVELGAADVASLELVDAEDLSLPPPPPVAVSSSLARTLSGKALAASVGETHNVEAQIPLSDHEDSPKSGP